MEKKEPQKWGLKVLITSYKFCNKFIINKLKVIRLGLGQFLCFAYVSMVSRVAIFRGIRFV